MNPLTKLFPEAERTRIEEAIGAAEARTEAEIVVAVAPDSGRYDRPEDVVGLGLGLLSLVALRYTLPNLFTLEWIIVTLVSAYFGGVLLAMLLPPLRRVLTLRQHMLEEVSLTARAVYFDQELQRTANACGVLIYISMFEHMAAVVADNRVTDALGQEELERLCGELTAEMRRHSPADAIVHIVERAGDRLSAILPRPEGAVNQLPNKLLLLE